MNAARAEIEQRKLDQDEEARIAEPFIYHAPLMRRPNKTSLLLSERRSKDMPTSGFTHEPQTTDEFWSRARLQYAVRDRARLYQASQLAHVRLMKVLSIDIFGKRAEENARIADNLRDHWKHQNSFAE